MAVLPTFEPGQAPDTIAKLGLQGQSDASNWMTQADQRQQTQANTVETQQRTQQIQAMMPALVAKSAADVATAKNTIATAAAQQQARATAAPMATQANNDFLSIMGLSNDPNDDMAMPEDPVELHTERMNQLSALQAKYSGLELVPEMKHVYDMIEAAKKNEYDMVGKHLSAQTELAARKYQYDSMTDRAQIAAEARENAAATTAGAHVEGAKIAAGARTEAAATTASAGMNKEAFKQFNDTALTYEAAALKEPDADKAAQMLATAKQFRDRAQQIEQGAAQPAAGGAASPNITLPGADAAPAPSAAAPAAPAAASAPVKMNDWEQARHLETRYALPRP